MRISDWSSDVCSSDLLPARRQQHGLVQLRGALGTFDQLESHDAGGVDGAVDLRRQPAQPRIGGVDGAEHVARRAAVALHAPEQARSEEHTSELQSLMRISYAVFCLKTKKTAHQH